MEQGGEGETECFHPLVHSPNVHSVQDWVMPKAGAWNAIKVSHVGAGTQVLCPTFVAFQAHQQGASLYVEWPGIQQLSL